MKVDTISEAVQYLQHSIEHESMRREIKLDTAILKPYEKVAKMVPASDLC